MLTNLENLVQTIIGFFTRSASNGIVTIGNYWQPLSSVSIKCKVVHISNTTNEILIVKQDEKVFYIPSNTIFTFNNVNDLSTLSVKTENEQDNNITFRYEY